MRNRRPTSTTPAPDNQAHATVPLLLGIELVRADVARSVVGLELGDAPYGGSITWALFIDGAVAGRTDEPLTDDAAQAWARRVTGGDVRFQLAHRAGGYWLADATDTGKLPPPGSGWSR
ncbi:hypothetical protein EV188_101425 [Actinomycetospora succinea]|uniref:Uncharacterized protein n=1 Tax=Actinomycetospora succinea TaxID=663603 RepID=A0A4R6VRI5_9PSEU|nr:hypothetical protein [Actinomycetospora succinea]TDQ65176.1 hypothetical protein EV188_101425 [Actinomycetospora succinea]